MTAEKKFEDMSLADLVELGRLFESVGAGPALVQALSERRHLLPRCVQAVQNLIDEDTYYRPTRITLSSDEWKTAGYGRDNVEVKVKIRSDRDDGLRLQVMWLPEDAVRETRVPPDVWVDLGYGVCICHEAGNDFFVRSPKAAPLYYAPRPT